MEVEARRIVKVCVQYQKHGKIMHAPGVEIGGILAICLFDNSRIDIGGKLPTAPWWKVCLTVAVNYFSK